MDKPRKYEAEYKKEAVKLAKEVGAKKQAKNWKYRMELCMTGSKKKWKVTVQEYRASWKKLKVFNI